MTDFANRYVSIERESSYGTSASVSTLYGEVDDESIQHRFDIIERGDMNYWAMQKSANGKEYSEGDLNFALQADDFCGMLLYGAMGKDVATSQAHAMTETTANSLPSFTIKVGRESKEHTYTGMMVNRMSLTANVGEYVSASFSFVGKAESALGSLSTPDWGAGANKSGSSAVDGFHFADCAVKFNDDTDASTFVKSFTLELNNNLDTDNACAIGSSTYTRAPIMQRREITGTLEFNQPILDGSTPSGQNGEPDYAELTAIAGLEVNGVTTYAIQFLLSDGTNTCTINLVDVRYEAPSANVSGRDVETMSVNYRGYIDPTAATKEAMNIAFNTSNAGNSGDNYSAL